MPLKPIDYSKGVQYKIVCNNPAITDCYNGSTCSLKDRKGEHKKRCTNPNAYSHNLKVYQFIRENGGWDNWTFIQLEEYPCKSKQELLARERHWFDIHKPTLNTISPMNTPEERKTYHVEYNAKYDANHIEERKKRCVEYNATHKEELKKWREDHTEGKKEYNVEYYEQNKVKLLAKYKEQITCECGCTIRNSDLSRHRKTNNHLNLMAQK